MEISLDHCFASIYTTALAPKDDIENLFTIFQQLVDQILTKVVNPVVNVRGQSLQLQLVLYLIMFLVAQYILNSSFLINCLQMLLVKTLSSKQLRDLLSLFLRLHGLHES